jgi:hypothetical protein
MLKCEIFIFILVFFVIAIFYSIYLMVNPSIQYKRYNFAPFPKTKPDINIPIESYENSRIYGSNKQNCLASIKPCETTYDCSSCGSGYECSEVKKGQSVIINGKQLGEGKWCTPEKSKEFGCGLYTGRAIWSDQLGQQGWKCVCLYPELFGGKDCLTQYACKDINQPLEDQSTEYGNYLVNSKGQRWDPSDLDFYPPDGLSPYATEIKDGERVPVFTCKCDSVKPGVKYISLPNDLYRCHADPCTKDKGTQFWDPVAQECNCPYNFVKSNDGVCRSMADVCGAGNYWEPTTKRCECKTEGTKSEICSSNLYFRAGEKICENPLNPGGSFCSTPCNPSPCKNEKVDENGKKISICTKDKTTTGNYSCNCANAAEPETGFEWGGVNCERKCAKKDNKNFEYFTNPFMAQYCCDGVKAFQGTDAEGKNEKTYYSCKWPDS